MTNLRFAALVVVIAVLLWLLARQQPQPVSSDDGGLPPELLGQPDLYLLDARITQFDQLGELSYELESHHIRHFETDGMTRLAQPTLIMHSDPAAPWRATAKRGFIRRSPAPDGTIEEVVFLRDEVELEQRLTNGSFTRLRTPALYVYPGREFAQSSDDVMIDTEVGRTRGHGMTFDMSNATLNVFSGAQSDDLRLKTIILPDQFK